MNIEPIIITDEDKKRIQEQAEWAEGWDNLVDFVCRSYGVPKELIQDVKDGSYSSSLASYYEWCWMRGTKQ